MSTQQTSSITELATKAAALIPTCPSDPLFYVAWRELVWDTARRLAELAGHLPLTVFEADDSWLEIEGTADHLLALAAMFRESRHLASDAGTPAAEGPRFFD